MTGWNSYIQQAKELIGRYESYFEQMEATLVKKSHYIKLLEMNLATLTSRADTMEDQLCHCGDREAPQEIQEDDAWSELSYITQEYYTPPVTMMRMIEAPPAIVPVGDLTGGKGQYTQWVHCELTVGSETINSQCTHWVYCPLPPVPGIPAMRGFLRHHQSQSISKFPATYECSFFLTGFPC